MKKEIHFLGETEALHTKILEYFWAAMDETSQA